MFVLVFLDASGGPNLHEWHDCTLFRQWLNSLSVI